MFNVMPDNRAEGRTTSMCPIFPRALLGHLSFEAWDTFVGKVGKLPPEDVVTPCTCPWGLLLLPPLFCFGGICCFVYKVKQSLKEQEARYSALLRSAFGARPGWTVDFVMNGHGTRAVRLVHGGDGGVGAGKAPVPV